jgi:hypothetical protein
MRYLPFFLCAVVLFGCGGGGLKQFDRFNAPQIVDMPDQKMLVVEMKGNPNQSAGPAIQALFKAYFSLKDLKVKKLVAPRARWPLGLDVSKEQWIGYYGMPVPEEVTGLPEQSKDEIPVRFETWKYGHVAQILHVGAYGEEPATVNKLMKYVDEQGYKIAGPHEEEYLKTRGMFSDNPAKYLTLIRYRVVKK